VVRVIRSSGQRRELFEEIRDSGNRDGWWGKVKNENGKEVNKIVDKRQLLRDVRTRWDSEFYMIRRVRVNRPVCINRISSQMYCLTFFSRQSITFSTIR
jgi:hypothetical protein